MKKGVTYIAMKNTATKKILIDCDNTFGVEGCDIDDGLAIIYALGSGDCDVLGITTTFGNSSLDVVYPNTLRFMKEIAQAHIPVLEGGTLEQQTSEAAEYLVQIVNKHPGEISILATGSLTNLYHAWLIDDTFYDKVSEISLMGGITQPLVIGNKILNELNFSCHYEAAHNVLQHGHSIKIATGNHCLAALFKKTRFDELENSDDRFLRWLHGASQYWFAREKDVFGHTGIYKWDVFAAAALLNPELFDDHFVEITPDMQSLQTGMLLGAGEPKVVNLPLIRDVKDYEQHVYDIYSNFASNLPD